MYAFDERSEAIKKKDKVSAPLNTGIISHARDCMCREYGVNSKLALD